MTYWAKSAQRAKFDMKTYPDQDGNQIEPVVRLEPTAGANAPRNNQVVGNVGLYYVCYQLSKRGWNVMPTTRNARGIDIIIYSQDATRTHTIQVKSLSRRSPVPLGTKLEGLFGDFFIICRNVALDTPECFVLTPAEVRSLAHKGVKDANTTFWLQPKQYESLSFHEQWQRIGKGTLELA
jgi:hypothetical protein